MTEQIAAKMIACGQVRTVCLGAICAARRMLTNLVVVFSGVNLQGPLRNTLKFPWVPWCAYLHSCIRVPFTSFVQQRNTFMRAHRDMNNAAQRVNAVLPCSAFTGGGVWATALHSLHYLHSPAPHVPPATNLDSK